MGNPYQGFLSPYKRKKKLIHSGWISTRRDEPHRGKGQGDERWADGGERSVSSTGCGRELGEDIAFTCAGPGADSTLTWSRPVPL
jgi:hypothetical protein